MKKSNIILINPSLSFEGKKFPNVAFPLTSIMLLATILDKEGYPVTIIDGNRYDSQECLENILKQINSSTLYVGFSVLTSQVPWCYGILKEVKRVFPHVRIVWGGAHPTLYPDQTISDDTIDIVVQNEACSTIALLTKTIENNNDLSTVPGIYFKHDNRVIKTSAYIPDDIEKIPEINLSLFDINHYSHNNTVALQYKVPGENVVSLPILTGLGCPFKCTFCINVILKRTYRFKTAERLVDRIEYLQKKYNASFFQFLDENFFSNKKRVFEFIDLVEKRGLKFYFWACLRVSYFRDSYITVEVAERLKKIGMITAVMGAECGSQTMLDRIKKQIRVEDTIQAAEVLAKVGITPRMTFMAGLIGETKEEILATYRLVLKLKSINKMATISIFNFAAYPGSPEYAEAVEKYNLEEPENLSEWAKVDFSGYLGFYSVQSKPWIFNKKIFNRMNHYYNLGFQFPERKGIVFNFSYSILQRSIRLRFKYGFFSFPVELSLVKFIMKNVLKIDQSKWFRE